MFVPPFGYDKIHANKSDFKKHVKKEEVKRKEYPKTGGLQHQNQLNKDIGAILDLCRKNQRGQEQKCRQQHQGKANAVHSQPVSYA